MSKEELSVFMLPEEEEEFLKVCDFDYLMNFGREIQIVGQNVKDLLIAHDFCPQLAPHLTKQVMAAIEFVVFQYKDFLPSLEYYSKRYKEKFPDFITEKEIEAFWEEYNARTPWKPL